MKSAVFDVAVHGIGVFADSKCACICRAVPVDALMGMHSRYVGLPGRYPLLRSLFMAPKDMVRTLCSDDEPRPLIAGQGDQGAGTEEDLSWAVQVSSRQMHLSQGNG